MVRLLIILAILAVAFIVFCLVDAAMTEKERVRTLQKQLWIPLIVFLPVIGGVLWLTMGKARREKAHGSAYDTAPGGGRGVAADPNAAERARQEAESDALIAELEKRLQELDAEDFSAGADGAEKTAKPGAMAGHTEEAADSGDKADSDDVANADADTSAAENEIAGDTDNEAGK